MNSKIIIKHNFNTYLKEGFDIRKISLEKVHAIDGKDFEYLVNILNIKDGYRILDAGSGYGAVTREILIRNKEKNIKIFLTDLFIEQLKLAINKLSDQFGTELILEKCQFNFESIEKTNYKNDYFDRIVAKMLLHELPVNSTNNNKETNRMLLGLFEMNRILKPKAKLFIWDVTLSKSNQQLIQDIIKKKDMLAGYNYLVENRYLPTKNELIFLLKEAGFRDIKIEKYINYSFNTRLRLEYEFNNELGKLIEFHKYIRNEVLKYPKGILEDIKYKDNSKEISFTIPISILSAEK